MSPPFVIISLSALIAFGVAVAEHVESDALQAQLAAVKTEFAQSERASAAQRQADIAGTSRALINMLGGTSRPKDSL